MALNGDVHVDSSFRALMPATTLAAAQSLVAVAASGATGPLLKVGGSKYLVAEAILTVAGGGTTAKAYVQTTIDGSTWFDIICFAFTNTTASKIAAVSADIAFAASPYAPLTPSDGALTDNTCVNGILGNGFRVKYVTTGTFTGATTLAVWAQVKG